MNDEDIEFLEGGNYISFATRKKSGDFVATPDAIAAERLVATDEGIDYTVGAAVMVEDEEEDQATEEA